MPQVYVAKHNVHEECTVITAIRFATARTTVRVIRQRENVSAPADGKERTATCHVCKDSTEWDVKKNAPKES